MGLPTRVKNMLIEELKRSYILKEKIREYTKNGHDFDLQETSIKFKPNEANLHYSVYIQTICYVNRFHKNLNKSSI